jgi:hypothetical protein
MSMEMLVQARERKGLLAHRRSATLLELLLLALGLGNTLVEDVGVLGLREEKNHVSHAGFYNVHVKRETYGGVLGGLGVAALESHAMTLVLQTLGSNQTLNARSLGVGLGSLLLGLHLTANDKLADLELKKKVRIQAFQKEQNHSDSVSCMMKNRRQWKGKVNPHHHPC